MPRGRHRHSPPLHRVLPPSAIAGVSLVCAVGPWLFTDAFALRVLAAGAAVTAVAGAVVMRRWDTSAGKRVADLTRARASDEWRHEERVAELETDLDESRELRVKLEQKLRAKRTELAGLRNEHAALLRRYATAETERATALEGRRQLAIEASVPARALPAARTAPDAVETPDSPDTPESPDTLESPETPDSPDAADLSDAVGSPDTPEAVETSEEPDEAEEPEEPEESRESEESEESEGAASGSGTEAIEAFIAADDDTAPLDADAEVPAEAGTGTGTGTGTDESPEVFSPVGSSLFLRAGAALSRTAGSAQDAEGAQAEGAQAEGVMAGAVSTSVALALLDARPAAAVTPEDAVPAADPDADPATAESLTSGPGRGESALDAAVKRDAAAKKRAALQKGAVVTKGAVATKELVAAKDTVANGEAPKGAPATEAGPSSDSVAEAGGAQGKPEAVGEHQRAAAEAEPSQSAPSATSARPPQAEAAQPARAALPAKRSGHFTVPTAVAVVPHTAPVRRPSVEGGFDFFGTQKEASDAAAMEAVQNEDLADVVGQEALALHKAEAESGFKPASEASRGADRQVIDLTAHDETEHINMTGLRSAVS
ncbi:hypothetical protein ABZ153_26585 [Streptomyces sp. NPDC006290]|uniref:hypothetical protein n=1 Tax=Streptomyces sp. NPDC006290 TaxID=3156745 RepID=UPI0033BB7B00